MSESWPIIWTDETARDAATAAQVARAERMASNTLRMLTLYRVGQLSVKVMPRTLHCNSPFTPHDPNVDPIFASADSLKNCSCIFGCSCAGDGRVYLKGPVASVQEVSVRGTALEPSVYGVVDGMWLVRTDGGTFPSCAGADFTVTYTIGAPVSTLGQLAAGVLAAEFLKLFSGNKNCRLPRTVTNLSRQGMNMTLDKGLFDEGLTGLHEPDIFIQQWNPYALKTRPTVWSPDVQEPSTLGGW